MLDKNEYYIMQADNICILTVTQEDKYFYIVNFLTPCHKILQTIKKIQL